MTRSSKLAVVAVCTMFGLGLVLGGFVGPVTEVRAEILHVDDDFTDPAEDTDGDTDFRHIQAAIDAAVDGDEVLVQPGTYDENIDFSGKAITVRSTDPENEEIVESTIIDGGARTSVVTFKNGEGGGSVLNGVLLQNGSASHGGGIHCDASSPNIDNCWIINNFAHYGGGTYCSTAAPNITSCTIRQNSASITGGGIYACFESHPNIIDCRIESNSALNFTGGGVGLASFSDATITDCRITDNFAFNNGGGILCSQSSPTINRCNISQNEARTYGGGIWCASTCSPVISNCMIDRNRATRTDSGAGNGGGIAFRSGGSPTIINCTICDNNANGSGGGIYFYELYSVVTLTATIINCTIAENSAIYSPFRKKIFKNSLNAQSIGV